MAQAKAMEHVVHGQPNIYAFFMAVAADLLLPGGELVAITPRSYFNGSYFTQFRKWFFERMTVRQIHVFESRTEAFNDDAVLQENVILLAEKGGCPRDIVLTTSLGRNLDDVGESSAHYAKVIDNSSGEHIIRVTTNSFEHKIIEAIDALPNRFRDLGFEIRPGQLFHFVQLSICDTSGRRIRPRYCGCTMFAHSSPNFLRGKENPRTLS